MCVAQGNVFCPYPGVLCTPGCARPVLETPGAEDDALPPSPLPKYQLSTSIFPFSPACSGPCLAVTVTGTFRAASRGDAAGEDGSGRSAPSSRRPLEAQHQSPRPQGTPEPGGVQGSGSGARSSLPAVGVGAFLMNTGKRMQSLALIFKMSSIYPEGSSVRSSPRSCLRGLFQGSPAHAPCTRCCPSRCPNAPAAGTRGWQSEHPANATEKTGKTLHRASVLGVWQAAAPSLHLAPEPSLRQLRAPVVKQ